MHPLATIAAAAAAIVGAVIWATITKVTGYEIGYVAWGIGLLVGGASYAMGGRGVSSGVIAGVLAFLSMAGGRAVSIDIGIMEAIKEDLTKDFYEEVKDDLVSYPGTDDVDVLKAFLVDRGYEVAPVTEEGLQSFMSNFAPNYDRWKDQIPGFEDWQTEFAKSQKDLLVDEVGRLEVLKESLGMMDLLFVLLGVVTAFKLAGQDEEKEPTVIREDDPEDPQSLT